MEIKKPIPTFPPLRLLLNSLKIQKQRSLPQHDYSNSFRLILRLEKTAGEDARARPHDQAVYLPAALASCLRPGSGFGFGFGAFLVSRLPVSLFPMAAVLPE
jgi:hypothetical protein